MRLAIGACLILGLALRLTRYLLRYPLWGDECLLAANFLGREYVDYLRPLSNCQICPILFLWVEHSIVQLFGFSELSLRLFPFLCGLASVLVFWHLCRRVLRGIPLLLAMAIFAVAYYPIRHGAEVKPYASDLLVALLLMTLAVEWLRRPDQVRWLWGLLVMAPLAVGISYPAVFVAGGTSLALLRTVCRRRCWKTMALYAGFNVALVGGFCASYLLVGRSQQTGYMQASARQDWGDAFPPLAEPQWLPYWFIDTHLGEMFAYPVGGARGGSVLTFLSFVVGALALWRHGRRAWLGLCLAPFGLGLLAAALEKYPYGFHPRTMQYVVPAICLLSGLGAAVLLSQISPQRRWRGAALAVLGLWLVGIGCGARDLFKPFKSQTDHDHRLFARWFWVDKARDAELVCVGTDLKKDFYGDGSFRIAPAYSCYQRIYSPAHRRGPQQPQWHAVSAAHPLRCVVYSNPILKCDEATFGQWLQEMTTRFDLASHQRHAVNLGMGDHLEHDYEVYEFVPKNPFAPP